MNNWIYKIVFCVLLAGSLSGCTKFLDLPARNERAVLALEDIKANLAGYLYAQSTMANSAVVGLCPIFRYDMVKMFEAYSDNIDFNKALVSNYLVPNNTMTEKNYANLLLYNDFDTPGVIWKNYYETIGFLNALIDEMPNVTYEDQTEYDQIMGEMLTHRAYYFFKLFQYFAPYKKASEGIPVYLHTGENVMGVSMGRKTHAEVYQTILTDLNNALSLLQKSGSKDKFNLFFTSWRLNHILAQVYWYKAGSPAGEASDWTNAEKYADAAVKGIDDYIPTTSEQINTTNKGSNGNYPAFYLYSSMYGGVSGIWASTWAYMGYNPSSIPAPSDFYNLFTPDDIRTSCYFSGVNTINDAWPDGNAYGSKNGRFFLFRPEEAYLILAEARYHTKGDALGTLNKFKSFRNAGTFSGSGEPLLKEIMNERRKEFFGDTDKRWLDLKRYGDVTITRKMTFFEKEYTITVAPDDYRYALPIPLDELQQNNAISQNEGWVQLEF